MSLLWPKEKCGGGVAKSSGKARLPEVDLADMTPEERLQRERRDEKNRKERERRAHRKIEKQRLTKEAELAQNAAPPAGPQGGLAVGKGQPGARVCEGEQRNGTELLRDEKGKFVGSNDESS
jgi:hypothetical protein